VASGTDGLSLYLGRRDHDHPLLGKVLAEQRDGDLGLWHPAALSGERARLGRRVSQGCLTGADSVYHLQLLVTGPDGPTNCDFFEEYQ
jgi:hypothetical protein